MKDLLIEVVEQLGYPVKLQGSLNPDEEYPSSFFTFWNNSVDGYEIYNNEEHAYVWDFDLNFYSTDADLVNTKLLEAKELLKQNGFIVTGKGHDIASDEPTQTGRGINVLKIEK